MNGAPFRFPWQATAKDYHRLVLTNSDDKREADTDNHEFPEARWLNHVEAKASAVPEGPEPTGLIQWEVESTARRPRKQSTPISPGSRPSTQPIEMSEIQIYGADPISKKSTISNEAVHSKPGSTDEWSNESDEWINDSDGGELGNQPATQLWQIRGIISEKIKFGQKFYQVDWAPTWEPKEDLPEDVVADWEGQQAQSNARKRLRRSGNGVK